MQSLLWLVVVCLAAVLANAGTRLADGEEPPYSSHPKSSTTPSYFNRPARRGVSGKSRFSHPGPKRRPFHPPRGGYGSHFYPPPFQVLPPSPKTRKSLTQLDRLYSRVHTIYAQILFFSEKTSALATAMSILQTKVNKLTTIEMDAFNSTHIAQKATASGIDEAIFNTSQELASMANNVNALASMNQANTQTVSRADRSLASQQALDVQQQKALGSLDKKIKDLKPKLTQLKKNKLAALKLVVERDEVRLKSIKKRESRRMCDLGEVDLREGQLRAEYPYQNEFQSRPGAYIYGLRGFNLDEKALQGKPAHFGYGPPPTEPESKGMTVHAYTTPKSLVLQLFDESFGKTKFKNGAISFYVCTMGPGASPANYYYY